MHGERHRRCCQRSTFVAISKVDSALPLRLIQPSEPMRGSCLCSGNTAILKPSEHASVTCLELAAIAEAVKLPAGVLNVITGLGADAGAPLRCLTSKSLSPYLSSLDLFSFPRFLVLRSSRRPSSCRRACST